MTKLLKFIRFRNRFLSDTISNLTINLTQKDSIDSFKFVGRNYCCLMDIMDRLNQCYTFQVNFLQMTAIDNMAKSIATVFIRFQMIFNTGFTFIGSVFSFYALYRRIIQQDELFEPLIWIHMNWLSFYLASIFLAIHIGTQLTNEVWLNQQLYR